jgi:hypothetical protein
VRFIPVASGSVSVGKIRKPFDRLLDPLSRFQMFNGRQRCPISTDSIARCGPSFAPGREPG